MVLYQFSDHSHFRVYQTHSLVDSWVKEPIDVTTVFEKLATKGIRTLTRPGEQGCARPAVGLDDMRSQIAGACDLLPQC